MVMSFCLWLAAQSTYFTLLHSRGLAAGSSSAYPNPTHRLSSYPSLNPSFSSTGLHASLSVRKRTGLPRQIEPMPIYHAESTMFSASRPQSYAEKS